MINNEILSFIKDQLAQGIAKNQVKEMLVGEGGWDEKDVEEAFETINFSGTSYPAVLKNVSAQAEKEEKELASSIAPAAGVKSGFTPASELMNALSGSTKPNPVSFSPGLSHVEQPKTMEPSTAPVSFSPVDIAPPSRLNSEPAVSSPVTGNNGLGSLRARIASGVSAPAPVSEPASFFPPPTISPVAEPALHSSPKPLPVTAPTTFTPPVVTVASAPTVAHTPSVFSSLPFMHKAAPVTPVPVVTPPVTSSMPSLSSSQNPQPIAVFPKGQAGILNPRLSPTPAQLATMKSQKSGGGHFFLATMLFIIGLAIGAISMNAYMKGYIKTDALNGLIDKGMEMIGLGTVTAPSSETSATSTPENEG